MCCKSFLHVCQYIQLTRINSTIYSMLSQSHQIMRGLFVFLLDITTSQIPGGAVFCIYEITMPNGTVGPVQYKLDCK